MQRRIRIAVDVMGGDFAPQETVKGAIQAARHDGTEIMLVGHRDVVDAELAKYSTAGLHVHTFHAEESIPDGGNPVAAIREKKDASILVANRLVKEGWADGVVSVGHSGACLLASSLVLGRLPGIERPSVGGCFPFSPNTFFLDVGTNANCTAEHLFQFAVIGTVYMQTMFGIANPTVAVLSNGVEEGKGNRVTKQAYQMLQESDLNFVGNVEGYDLINCRANVVVCDGYTGNVVIKFVEGFSQDLARTLERALGEHWAAVAEIPEIRRLRLMSDLGNFDGGILFGVDGLSVIGHGRSDAAAVRRFIQRAAHAVENQMVERLKEALAYQMSRMGELLAASPA